MNLHTVVVGVDDSKGTTRTLEWVAAVFEGTGTDVVAVHCLPPLLEDLFALPPLDFDLWRAQRLEAFKRWCAPLRTGGIDYRTRVVEFEPAEGLHRVADDEEADLIVVGSHGHGRFGRGAVPSKLMSHATRPVVVVPSLV